MLERVGSMSGEIDRIRRQTESVQEVLAATRTGDTAFDLLSEALDAFREQAVRLLEGARAGWTCSIATTSASRRAIRRATTRSTTKASTRR